MKWLNIFFHRKCLQFFDWSLALYARGLETAPELYGRKDWQDARAIRKARGVLVARLERLLK